jgi:hypothetical protein
VIYEYAVEPHLLSGWQQFRYFSEKFGVSRGRLISRFPKHWALIVYQSLDRCGDVEKKRIEERLKQLTEKCLMPRRYEWSDGSWIENAIEEHSKRAFHAIIGVANPAAVDFVLCGEQLDETDPLWKIEQEQRIPRRAGDMAGAAARLLSISEEIVFVDPYFDPQLHRFRKPLEQFLIAASTNRPKGLLRRIEYHTSDRLARADMESHCARSLRRLVPGGLRLRIVRWHTDDLHNRFVLTERGGLKFAQGLSEGATPGSDVVNLLGEQVHREIWAEYDRAKTKFHFVDEWEVV